MDFVLTRHPSPGEVPTGLLLGEGAPQDEGRHKMVGVFMESFEREGLAAPRLPELNMGGWNPKKSVGQLLQSNLCPK